MLKVAISIFLFFLFCSNAYSNKTFGKTVSSIFVLSSSASLLNKSTKTSSKKAKKTTTQEKQKKETTSQTSKKSSSHTKKKEVGKKQRWRCSAYTSPQYKRMVGRWRKVPKISGPKYRAGYRDLTIYSVNMGERVRVFPFLPDGTMDPEALKQITHLMRDKETEEEHPVSERLIKLLYKLADHFKARQITVISGYRERPEGKREGHHATGNAIDFMIPGISLPMLAKISRQLGRVGVGYYPVSGFVHLDIRKRSYFWNDRSGPGKSGCPFQVMSKFTYKFDGKWRPEKDEPKLHKNRKGELLGELSESGVAGSSKAGSSR